MTTENSDPHHPTSSQSTDYIVPSCHKSGFKRFHPFHGENIVLSEDNTVAYRHKSFAHGLTFSEKPLNPGEMFLVEIFANEGGWSGHMRLGLTQLSPLSISRNGMMPQYALPDLVNKYSSWIYGISKAHNKAFEYKTDRAKCRRLNGKGLKKSREIRSSKIPLTLLKLSRPNQEDILPTDVGSRIGVMYLPNDSKEAEMHYVINGEDQGVCVEHIPYTNAPLYVVVDVYGTTKKVKIVQLGVPTLQAACRDAILSLITEKAVSLLPLPKLLKKYLLFQS